MLPSQVAELSNFQLGALMANSILHLETNQFSALSQSQLQSLSIIQIKSLSIEVRNLLLGNSALLNKLTQEQRNALFYN